MGGGAVTRNCGCPESAVIVDESKHDEWHRLILPLTTADVTTLEASYGRPSYPTRTYVDDQFDAERAREDLRRQLAAS